jgi:hypothetical protein
MTRRLLGVCLGLAALLGVTARGAAKPPDLPADQKITVTPLRVQNFESVLPVSDMPAPPFVPPKVVEWLRAEFVCPGRLWSSPAGEREPWRRLDELVQEERATGSLLFGVGVNSDSGLTGRIVLGERSFDILARGPAGERRRVIVRLRPAERRVLATSLLFIAHPFLTLMPVDVLVEEEEECEVEEGCHPQADPTHGVPPPKPIRPRTSRDPVNVPAGEPLGMPEEGGLTCPYLREKQAADRHVRMLADEDLSRGVMENLRRLEVAGEGLEAAKELARRGRTVEAMACLEVVSELCPGSSFDRRVAEVWAGVLAGAYDGRHGPEEAAEAQESQAQPAGEAPPPGTARIEKRLRSTVSLKFKDAPLQVVVKDLRDYLGVPVVFDLADLREAGVNLDVPVTVNVEGVPLKSALDVVLDQVHLTYRVEPKAVVIVTKPREGGRVTMRTYPVGDLLDAIDRNPAPWAMERVANPSLGNPDLLVRLLTSGTNPRAWVEGGGCGTIAYCPQNASLVVQQTPDVQEQVEGMLAATRRVYGLGDGSARQAPPAEPQPACPPCPKAQALHARVAGVKEQVDGLMKACHLAMAEKRYEKAAALAREAHALDPARVEADPLVYKMHLLAEKCGKRAEKPAGPAKPKQGPCPAGPSNYPRQKAAPGAGRAQPSGFGEAGYAPADPQLPVPLGSSRPEDAGPFVFSGGMIRPEETTAPATSEQKKAMGQVLAAMIEAFATDHPLGVGVEINLDRGGVRVYYTTPLDGEVYHLLYQGGFAVWKTPAPGEKEK